MLQMDLRSLLRAHDSLSIILGDVNEVTSPCERIGSNFCQKGVDLFNEVISTSGLVEPHLCGMRYTRMNNHSPIILCNSTTFGPVPFKFYNSWIELNDLKPIVQASWTTTRPRLKNTRATILRDQLVTIDTKAESGPLKTTEIDNHANTVKELHDFEHRKIKDIRQKTKSRWALEGDENSSFFHGLINMRTNRSRINGLNILGSWVSEPLLIKDHIFQTYRAKFSEQNCIRPTFTSSLFKQLDITEVLLLDLPFTMQEIKDAVWECGGDKAPDPDGFTFKFIKSHWDILGHDIFCYMKEFETSSLIPRGCNSSFITLIPKVEDPLVIHDYRPISLIGCQYKTIAKVLANRLALVISLVVGESQTAFIKGRQIIDEPLMVDEIIS
ncbi:hypothetical protein Tco_0920873 [Tanacetum coccineum]